MARGKNRSRRRKTRKHYKETRIPSKRLRLGFRKIYAAATAVDYTEPETRVKRQTVYHGVKAPSTGRNTRSMPRRLRSSRRRGSPLASTAGFYSRKDKTQDPARKHRVCESRRVRREVMFATKKTGKGGQRKPTYINPDIVCKKRK